MNNILENVDKIWESVKLDARELVRTEELLEDLVEDVILTCEDIFESISKRIARKVGRNALDEDALMKMFYSICSKDKSIQEKIIMDLRAIKYRDPACESYMQAILYFKGFHAITLHRWAYYLWNNNRHQLAYYLQSLSSEIFTVDIHPAAYFGGGILLDHATSFVAGETSRVEDNVSILHEVTLGGNGTEVGDRHPKVKSGVLIGAGAKLIGNITIGECAKIGAGSVVLDDVRAHSTTVGVPSKEVGTPVEDQPCKDMIHYIDNI